MLGIRGVDERVQVMSRTQTRLIMDLVRTLTTVLPAQSEGPSAPTEHIETLESNVEVSMDLDIKEKREASKLST